MIFGSQIYVIALLFILSIVSGVLTKKYGSPYKITLLTFHKIASLVLTILIAVAFYNFLKDSGLSNKGLVLIIVTAALLLTAFVTGVLLSITASKENSPLKIVHKVSSVLTLILTGVIFYSWIE